MATKENEFGDKISKSDICAGVLFLISLASLVGGACARVYQEVCKHNARTAQKCQIIHGQHLK